MLKKYSLITEAAAVKSLVKAPARDPQVARVGDPKSIIDDPDAPTNTMRKQAAELKAKAELVAAKAQLARTQHDAAKSMEELKQQQADEQKDKELQQQQQQAAEDPTVDPNAVQSQG